MVKRISNHFFLLLFLTGWKIFVSRRRRQAGTSEEPRCLRESFISFKCLRPALLTAAKTTHERGLDDSGNLRREPPANQEKGRTKNVVIDRICDVQLFSFPLDNGQSTLYFLGYSKRVSLVAMATH
jgi:hypothetical protein